MNFDAPDFIVFKKSQIKNAKKNMDLIHFTVLLKVLLF